MNVPSQPVPRWYWIVCIGITLWMAIGVLSLVMELLMDEAAIAALPDGRRALHEGRPLWIDVVYGVATLSGLSGGVGLLLRKAWAVPTLLVSVVGVIAMLLAFVVVLDSIAMVGRAAALTLPTVVVVSTAASWWFGTVVRRKGWLV